MQRQHCMDEAVPGIGKLQVPGPAIEQASACSSTCLQLSLPSAEWPKCQVLAEKISLG